MGNWVVVVDDVQLILTSAEEILKKAGMRVSTLSSGKELLSFMESNSPDLILLDIIMPDMDGFDTYRALREYEERSGKKQTPVIFLTGDDKKETERRGLKAGASDFIHKPLDEGVLIKRINNTITSSKAMEGLIREDTLDKLTGFYTKASGEEKIIGLCKKADGALMIMDLDNFTMVNEKYGHDMGDRVLIAFAGVVRRNVRAGDILCRAGGDKLMVYFPNLMRKEAIDSLSHWLNVLLMKEADSLLGKNHGIPLGISIGVAIAEAENNNYQELYRLADRALYRAKRNGKHGYELYDNDFTEEDSAEQLEQELSRIEHTILGCEDENAAMLMARDVFYRNYRYTERIMSRCGKPVAKILFSLSVNEKAEDETDLSEAVSEFGKILTDNLNNTDTVLLWEQNMYFAVLPFITQAELPGIIDTITKAWSRTAVSDRIKVRTCSCVYGVK